MGLIVKKKVLGIYILGVCILGLTGCGYDKSNPIVFEQASTEDYAYIIYGDREYVPYSACSPKDRTKYLGYIKGNEQEEIYTFKNYSEEEWLINLLNTGATKECMLWKEKNVTNIPKGLSSEYEWNN